MQILDSFCPLDSRKSNNTLLKYILKISPTETKQAKQKQQLPARYEK